jgi:cell pole-organizing protein PopZ
MGTVIPLAFDGRRRSPRRHDSHRTLEDLTREMLLPMLKEWLDENLPTIVDRLVRAEIDRVSRSPSHTSPTSPEKTD